MKRLLVVLGLVALSISGLAVAWYARHRAISPPAAILPVPSDVVLHATFLSHKLDKLTPDDPVWQKVKPASVPLTYQVLMLPWGKSDKGPMEVRAFHDEHRIYFRLEWSDATEDRGGARIEDLPDTAAVMFSLQTQQTASLMMGFLGRVNIWHWKANWDQEVWAKAPESPANADFYPFENDATFYPARAAGNLRALPLRSSAVEDIFSEGPGSITPKEKQVVRGRGRWREGRWQVVLARELSARDSGDLQFVAGPKTRMAFAAWDGSRGEKGSRKSISEWVWLEIQAPPQNIASDGKPGKGE